MARKMTDHTKHGKPVPEAYAENTYRDDRGEETPGAHGTKKTYPESPHKMTVYLDTRKKKLLRT
jgi:hypothetical protein